MKRFVYLAFSLTIAVVIIQGIFNFFIMRAKPATMAIPSNQLINRNIIFTPTPFLSFVGDIIYQRPGDRMGRTIIYKNETYPNPGIGEFYSTQVSPPRLKKIIGVFVDWESIKDSKDRYIILEDPLQSTKLPKARVAFEKSAFFDSGNSPTSLAVENLSTQKIESTGKRILSLSPYDMNNLFAQGDIVVAQTALDTKGRPEVDEKGVILAGRLIVRRIGGFQQLGI